MSKSEERVRSKLVGVRLTEDDYKLLLDEARALNVSASEFLRRAMAAEINVLRRQRAIREERALMGRGTTVGNPGTIEVIYGA